MFFPGLKVTLLFQTRSAEKARIVCRECKLELALVAKSNIAWFWNARIGKQHRKHDANKTRNQMLRVALPDEMPRTSQILLLKRKYAVSHRTVVPSPTQNHDGVSHRQIA